MFSNKLKENCFKIKKNTDLYTLLLEETSFLDIINPTDYQRMYHVKNDICEIILCKNCGKNPVKWNGKYKTFCSRRCSNSYVDTRNKMKLSILEKYGVENVAYSEEIKEKRKLTMIERYGVESPLSSNELLEKSKKTTLKNITKKFFDKVKENDQYDYSLVEYKTAHTKVKIICKKHGVFEQSPNNHLRGKGCPRCSNIVSSGEKEIVSYIKSHGIDVISNSRKIIKPFELDVYIKKYDIAIEYNGVYWHTVDRKYELYHLDKLNSCNDKGIKLIQFWDFEWNEKKEICKSIIDTNLGINDKIYARKTVVKLVDTKETQTFLNENHIQGYCVSSVNIGLYYDNCLVAIMTFSKPRFNKKYDWELIRFCNKLGITVVGGANKMMKYFEKLYTGKIISYSDKRLFTGNIYEMMGFVKLSTAKPNYFYHKDAEIIPRYKAQKHKLHKFLDDYDANLTENENMLNAGWKRVYDCGNDVWVKN